MAQQGSPQWSRNNFRITPNSEPVPIQVVGSSTFGRYSKIGSGLTYNMFISDGWLVNFAGYKKTKSFITNDVGSGRGLFHSTRGNIVIAVINASVFQINANLSVALVGTLQTTTGEVFMDENLNNQICIADGQYAYIYNYADASTPIPGNRVVPQTIVSSLLPNYVCFHNTFFLFGNANTNSTGAAWYAYVFNQPTGVTAIVEQTQLALSTKPDFAVAVRRLPGQGNNVIVFGKTVCEIWTQIGGIQNYRRNASSNIDYGCLSVSTIATCEQFTAWLAVNEDNSPIIMVYGAEGLRRISTDGIDYLMDNLKVPQDSTALFYTQDGHLFYQLTFFNMQDNLSLVYDFNTEKFFNLSDHDGDFHPARKMVYFNGTPFFISLKNASLYSSDTNITVYNENLSTNPLEWDPALVYPIARTRVCETIRKPDTGRFVVNSFVFALGQGEDEAFQELSLTAGAEDQLVLEDGSTFIISEDGEILVSEFSSAPNALIYRPRIDMAISKDSGTTWSNYVSRELNPIGKRKNIITYNNLGSANELNIKLRFWGLGNFVVNDGLVDLY